MAILIGPDGCDYTIDCGKKFVILKATDWESAKAELRELVIGTPSDEYTCGYEDGYHGERELEKATVVEISNKFEAPLGQWYAETRDAMRKKEAAAKLDEERREYEKLKAKFDKK